MGAKQIVVGVALFISVTIGLFLFLSYVFQLNEAVNVILAIVGGFGAEIVYRKKNQ
jgi:hypothetical protein